MRYLLTFSYDGSKFSGYQKQVDKRTVQEEVEKVLSKITNREITIHASGRTDAKVHAVNQKAHFDLESRMKPETIIHGLNSLLPEDIHVKKIKRVKSNFHARYDVKEKEYIYKINTTDYNVFERDYVYQYNRSLSYPRMQRAIKNFIGTQDFKAVSKAEYRASYERTITSAYIVANPKGMTIVFRGTGFLRYMVRNMVGLLIEVGSAKRTCDSIRDVLASRDRTKAGITAPPEGLYLNDVFYE